MPYPFPYQPFKQPVPPPVAAATQEICFRFDAKWVPYVLGVLKTLAVPRTWETEADRATGEANNLIAALIQATNDCAPDLPNTTDCIEFPPAAPFIEYHPISPFTAPGEVPPGYLAPPFLVATAESPFIDELGLIIGDVVLVPTSVPIAHASLEDLFPSIRIYVTGAGQVELHLLKHPLGGSAFITVDEDVIHNTRIIELKKDLFSLPPELATVDIEEFEFTESGPHTLDVVFVPLFNDDITSILGFGGGLRKVVLCGFDEVGEMFNVRQNTIHPCKLEKSIDGVTWEQWADLQKCPPKFRIGGFGHFEILDGDTWQPVEGETSDPGPAQPQWTNPPAGQQGNCLAGENIAAVFSDMLSQAKDGLELGLGAAEIVAPILLILGPFIAVGVAVAGAILAAGGFLIYGFGSAGLNDLLTNGSVNKLKCIIYCHAYPDGSVTAARFAHIIADVGTQIPGAGGEIVKFFLNAVGAVGLTRMGRAKDITTGSCGDCACTDRVTMTYNISFNGTTTRATGPATCEYGETITINSDAGVAFLGATIYQIDVNFAPCSHFEIMAVTGATLFNQQPSTNVPKAYWNCANTIQGNQSINGGNTLIAVGYNHDALRLICNSKTPFSIQVKLTKIP